MKQNIKLQDKENPFLGYTTTLPQILCHTNRKVTNIIVNLNDHSWLFIV